jgi:hypothetical protein
MRPHSVRVVESGSLSPNASREETVIVADVSFIDIFWSMLWFFFLFIWLVILFHILTDLFRDHTLSGGMKTLWIVFLVFLPFLAALVYLISRGKGMAERAAARQQQAQEQLEDYVRSVATPGDATASPTDQIAQAKQLLDAGTIDQAEVDRLKPKPSPDPAQHRDGDRSRRGSATPGVAGAAVAVGQKPWSSTPCQRASRSLPGVSGVVVSGGCWAAWTAAWTVG